MVEHSRKILALNERATSLSWNISPFHAFRVARASCHFTFAYFVFIYKLVNNRNPYESELFRFRSTDLSEQMSHDHDIGRSFEKT